LYECSRLFDENFLSGMIGDIGTKGQQTTSIPSDNIFSFSPNGDVVVCNIGRVRESYDEIVKEYEEVNKPKFQE
jgi:hypothetical protein